MDRFSAEKADMRAFPSSSPTLRRGRGLLRFFIMARSSSTVCAFFTVRACINSWVPHTVTVSPEASFVQEIARWSVVLHTQQFGLLSREERLWSVDFSRISSRYPRAVVRAKLSANRVSQPLARGSYERFERGGGG